MGSRGLKISFWRQLEELQNSLLHMGGLVQEAIAKAIESHKAQGTALAEEVIRNDDLIDSLELQIEEGYLALIAIQQPMAKDLRKVAALFKMIVDPEPMEYYGTDIARIVCRVGQEPLIKPLMDIPRMDEVAQRMVKEALDAYLRENTELAMKMVHGDDEVGSTGRSSRSF